MNIANPQFNMSKDLKPLIAGTLILALWLPQSFSQTNLISSAGFEDPTKWTHREGGSEIIDAADFALSGTKVLRLTNDFAGKKSDGLHAAAQTVTNGVLPGIEYEYRVNVRGVAVAGIDTGGKPIAALTWKNASGKTLARTSYMWAPYGTYDYTKMQIAAEAPPGAVQAVVDCRSWWDCTNGVTYWDELSLVARAFPKRGRLVKTLQAEDAAAFENCGPQTKHPGHSGSGYVEPAKPRAEASIEWRDIKVNAGRKTIAVRYSVEAGVSPWGLSVNDGAVIANKPLATGSPEAWATESWEADFNEMGNTLKLTFRKLLVGPQIDRVDIYDLN